MAKSPKKMAIGGSPYMPNLADSKYQDPAYIAAGQSNANRMNSMLKNARNSGSAPDFSQFGVPSMPKAGGEDINSLYQSMLGRAPDPTGIAANKGASAATIRQSIMESPEYANRMAGINQPELVLQKKGGKVIKKANGGIVKGNQWHGFGKSKTGKNNHGF